MAEGAHSGAAYTTCDHTTLNVVIRNMNLYHCPECDSCFWVSGGQVMMKDWVPQMGMMMAEWYAKKEGLEALETALNKPLPHADGERRNAVSGIMNMIGLRQNALSEGDSK